jgi:hypothetical protein
MMSSIAFKVSMSSKAMFQTEYRDGRVAFNVLDQGNCFQVPVVRKDFFKLMLPSSRLLPA